MTNALPAPHLLQLALESPIVSLGRKLGGPDELPKASTSRSGNLKTSPIGSWSIAAAIYLPKCAQLRLRADLTSCRQITSSYVVVQTFQGTQLTVLFAQDYLCSLRGRDVQGPIWRLPCPSADLRECEPIYYYYLPNQGARSTQPSILVHHWFFLGGRGPLFFVVSSATSPKP